MPKFKLVNTRTGAFKTVLIKGFLILGFFRFVVTPLFSEWHRFLSSSLSTYMMTLLKSNRKKWEAKEVVEQAEETHTELSDAEPETEISEEDDVTKESSEAISIIEFIAPPPR